MPDLQTLSQAGSTAEQQTASTAAKGPEAARTKIEPKAYLLIPKLVCGAHAMWHTTM